MSFTFAHSYLRLSHAHISLRNPHHQAELMGDLSSRDSTTLRRIVPRNSAASWDLHGHLEMLWWAERPSCAARSSVDFSR